MTRSKAVALTPAPDPDDGLPRGTGQRGTGDGLTAEGVTLSYGARQVVADASLELESGQIVALIGPNGSGKSTLLRSLARLHSLDGGAIELGDGSDALSLTSRAFARRVTLLAQARPTPSGVRVADLVGYGRHPHRARWGSHDPDGATAISRAMALTGVTPMADRSVDELSGGELQRVWVATCLAQATGVLLLDEPTNHLDLRYQVEILDLMRELAEDHGVAVGVVLHDLDHAASVADRLILLDRGRIHAAGVPEEVLTGENLSAVYGLPVEVDVERRTGRIAIRPIGRYATARAVPSA